MVQLNSKNWLLRLTFISVLVAIAPVSVANAFESFARNSGPEPHQVEFYLQGDQAQHRYESQAEPLQLRQYSQRHSGDLRSRSDVVREVKRRYPNSEILRIKLDRQAMVYRVRVYLSDGVVKVVSVNARR